MSLVGKREILSFLRIVIYVAVFAVFFGGRFFDYLLGGDYWNQIQYVLVSLFFVSLSEVLVVKFEPKNDTPDFLETIWIRYGTKILVVLAIASLIIVTVGPKFRTQHLVSVYSRGTIELPLLTEVIYEDSRYGYAFMDPFYSIVFKGTSDQKNELLKSTPEWATTVWSDGIQFTWATKALSDQYEIPETIKSIIGKESDGTTTFLGVELDSNLIYFSFYAK